MLLLLSREPPPAACASSSATSRFDLVWGTGARRWAVVGVVL